MLKEGRKLRFLEVELDPCTFQSQTNTIVRHRLETFPSKESILTNCFGGWIHGMPIIRSSSPNTEEKVRQLIALLEVYHREWNERNNGKIPFRFTLDQLQSVEFEWEMIHDEHQSIVHVSESLSSHINHLSSPISPLVAESAPPFKVQSTIDMLDQMPKILNMESWADYCGWYADMLSAAFHDFPYDAIDEYTLEKYLQHFLHESNSPFLKRARKHLLLLQLAMGFPEQPLHTSHQDRINKEKDVIKVRYEMQKLIRDHYRPLSEIVPVLKLIEIVHPELEKIQRCGVYLNELIGPEVHEEKARHLSWGRGQMIKQLLCSELHVIPAIHCDTGLARTHLAFAIRAAAMTMKERLTWKELRNFVTNWHEKTVLLNRLAQKQGEKGLEDPSVSREVQHVVDFRILVYGYLKNFCVPISKWNHDKQKVKLSGDEYYFAEPLNFLPSFIEGKQLIHYDYASGNPTGLSEAGLRFYETIL